MKTTYILCLIIVFLLTGLVFEFLTRPAREPRLVFRLLTKEPVEPDLTYIVIKNGLPIKNARVKEITRSSILFVCDRGLVDVPFSDLPPEFKDYYYGRKI